MPEAFHERRRFPRTTVAAGHELRLPVQMTVQVLDISASGVLVAAPQPLTEGTIAEIQARLGADPVLMQVEVQRVAPAAGKPDGRYRLGSRFVHVDEAGRRSIQRFLREGTS
jgi:c-di-GMP-binding flagellar brake protein YcgR